MGLVTQRRDYEQEARVLPELEAPRLDINARTAKLTSYLTSIGKPTTQQSVLKIMPIIPVIESVSPSLSFGTIIPKISMPLVPAIAAGGTVFSAGGSFSPVASSILGLGTAVGVMLIELGRHVVAQIAMEMAQEVASGAMERVGKRLDSRLKIRMQTSKGPGKGRHVTVRGPGAAIRHDSEEPYDEPCDWYEFWCWLA